jgi:hypothetical protein
MMAAISAARYGAAVTLFEKNDRLGKKLRITGNGRCNVTNDCERDEFLQNVPTNPRFLYAALSRFSTADTKQFFEDCGVPLKTERGKRVFPQSDKAQDIVDALAACCRLGSAFLRCLRFVLGLLIVFAALFFRFFLALISSGRVGDLLLFSAFGLFSLHRVGDFLLFSACRGFLRLQTKKILVIDVHKFLH